MSTLRHALLKWLSAAVWYIGAGVLTWKGGVRLLEAHAMLGTITWPALVGAVSAGLGALQGWTLFRQACIRNLKRIRRLESPMPWQFFRPWFFVALATMIGVAGVLSVWAATGPAAMLTTAGVDWLVGVSLLVSSVEFWR